MWFNIYTGGVTFQHRLKGLENQNIWDQTIKPLKNKIYEKSGKIIAKNLP